MEKISRRHFLKDMAAVAAVLVGAGSKSGAHADESVGKGQEGPLPGGASGLRWQERTLHPEVEKFADDLLREQKRFSVLVSRCKNVESAVWHVANTEDAAHQKNIDRLISDMKRALQIFAGNTGYPFFPKFPFSTPGPYSLEKMGSKEVRERRRTFVLEEYQNFFSAISHDVYVQNLLAEFARQHPSSQEGKQAVERWRQSGLALQEFVSIASRLNTELEAVTNKEAFWYWERIDQYARLAVGKQLSDARDYCAS